MIFVCLDQPILKTKEASTTDNSELKEAVWIDLLNPTKEEESRVEQLSSLDVPTSDEMREIEISSRLYRQDNALFMTALMIAQSESEHPKLEPVTFVLAPQQLITVRYIEPQAFKLFLNRLQYVDKNQHNAINLLLELLDACIDRLADILEYVGKKLDDYSQNIFQTQNDANEKPEYQNLMQQIGVHGDLNTKARESLITFNRVVTFLKQNASARIDAENQLRLSTIEKDIASLSDHASFISTKVNFLLDATLGMISIEQNNIIKIFSVAAVIFLPPTLIASIYGMNFHFMPELSWKWGYIMAICSMVVSSVIPYKYFKHKKWL